MPSVPPLALLLTDVVGSTQLAQAIGDARMAALWSAHDRAARELLRRWRGREIEKTDGLLALFTIASDAACYALDYHAALAKFDPPLLARAAIHVGPVTLRDSGPEYDDVGARHLDIDGLAKPIVARVMALALGGQTLVTEPAREALGATDLIVESQGHWRLKGLAEPIELFEIGEEHSRFLPPLDEAKAHRVVRQGDLWLPVRDIRHNLAAERDSFVGRGELLADLSRHVKGNRRLISVLGVGGTGKTRFALHYAWKFLSDHPGGAWFCDLSQARTVEGICFAVAQGLDVPLNKADVVGQLADAISGRGKCLVLLDNFEQVAQHAEETVGHWLGRAPSATFLVTTREALGIVGEEAFPLPTLPTSDASQLFRHRAESARRGFSPTPDDEEAIARLVAVLDGLPLAIELAAARVPVMSPRTLLSRMNERFSVLVSRKGRHDRQATLRATFDWSWELLTDNEKSGLAELSVFEGGFTLVSAEAVLSCCSGEDNFVATDLIGSLVDKSFVRAGNNERFDLLRSVRDYSETQLRTTGRYPGGGPAAFDAARGRHARHFAGVAAGTSQQGTSPDLDNFVVACERAIDGGEADLALATLEGAWRSLKLSGPFAVAIRLAEAASTVKTMSHHQRVRLGSIAGRALFLAGRLDHARTHLVAAREFALMTGLKGELANVLTSLAEMDVQEGEVEEARTGYRRAVELAREQADSLLLCDALNGMAHLHEQLGEYREARAGYEEALQIAKQANNERWVGGTLGNLGQLFADQGLPERALPLYEESVRIAHAIGDRQWEGNMLCNLGLLHHAEGRSGAAARDLNAALDIARDIGQSRLEAVVQCNLGLVHESLGDPGQARECHGRAIELARGRRDRRSCGQFLGYLGVLEARDGNIGAARAALAEGEALLKELGDRSSLGILLCGKAEAEHLAGDAAAARAALAGAANLAEQLEVAPQSELGVLLHKCRELPFGNAVSVND